MNFGDQLAAKSVLGLIDAQNLYTMTLGKGNLTIIPVGDSIVTGAAIENTSGMWYFGSTYGDVAIQLAGPRYRQIRNAGVGGQTSTQILARFDADVVAYAPDVALIQAGTNDLIQGIADSAFTTLFNNLEQMILKCLKAGILPILATPPPKGDATTATTVITATDEVMKAQPFYYALARHYRIPLIDTFRYLCSASNGAWGSATYSSDGIHPNATGVELLAPYAATVLRDLPPCPPYFAAAAEAAMGNLHNLMANGTFVNGAGGFGFWTLTTTLDSTRTQEIPPAGGFYTGKTCKVVRASAVQASICTGSALSGWSVGDVLEYTGRLKVSGLAPATAVGTTVNMAGAGTVWAIRPMSTRPNNGEFVWCMRTAPIPTGTTSISLTTITNDAGTYEFNNLTVQNVTRMKAIHTPGVLQ